MKTLKLIVNDQQRIDQISDTFTAVFPFLKLEFFSEKHLSGEASSNKLLIPRNETLGAWRSIHHSGEITISPTMKVSELEQLFSSVYGLGVQVFRKSGSVWLETILTDDWTLEEQNNEGESLSKKIEPEEPEYYQDRN